jgi:hypothetical protein
MRFKHGVVLMTTFSLLGVGFHVISSDSASASTLEVKYLLVGAGGSGSGVDAGMGGGGAGGVRSNVFEASSSTNYSITIGAPASGTTNGYNTAIGGSKIGQQAKDGGDSKISALGFTEIIANGGGGGSNQNSNARKGGSGGGAGSNWIGGVGIEGQGFAGGNGRVELNGRATYLMGGGGGGAGGVGGSGDGVGGGRGGVGTNLSTDAINSNLLSGVNASINNLGVQENAIGVLSDGQYYIAGGGAGGTTSNQIVTYGVGGLGGGGASSAAVANTGSGGGPNSNGAAGVAILSYTNKYQIFKGGTVTHSVDLGDSRIWYHVFKTSGQFVYAAPAIVSPLSVISGTDRKSVV